MDTFVALLRGINVGGKNSLPMQKLIGVFENAGMEYVRTYIQSGNVVFQSSGKSVSRLAADLRKDLESACSFHPGLCVLARDEYESIAKSNPFADEAVADPKSVHLYFLEAEPGAPDLDRLEECRANTERFELKGNILYLHAPHGIGKSKLAAKVEAAMGVPATARNWRTVSRLLQMIQDTG